MTKQNNHLCLKLKGCDVNTRKITRSINTNQEGENCPSQAVKVEITNVKLLVCQKTLELIPALKALTVSGQR